MTIRKLAILLFATIVLASSCQTVDAAPDYSDFASSCQTVDTAPDYSDPSYWAYYGEGNADGVDLFMVCPCVDMGGDGRLNMMLSDEDAKASFVGALNMERGIYDEVAIMYAPFYRQMTFPVFEQGISTSGRHFEIAYGDVEPLFPGEAPTLTWDAIASEKAVLLVSGIASPAPFEQAVRTYTDRLITLAFPDHHAFTPADIQKIQRRFDQLDASSRIMITTEKDAARLRELTFLPRAWAKMQPSASSSGVRLTGAARMPNSGNAQ